MLEGLAYLHHPLRAAASEQYIAVSLGMLREIQRTGDIFFPKRWTDATLGGHSSPSAAQIVSDFIAALPPDYPDRLRRVLLSSSDDLLRMRGPGPERPQDGLGRVEVIVGRGGDGVAGREEWNPRRKTQHGAAMSGRLGAVGVRGQSGSELRKCPIRRGLFEGDDVVATLTGMAAPGEREGRGINSARDKPNRIGLGDYRARAFTRGPASSARCDAAR